MAGQNVAEEFVAIAGIFATGDPATVTAPTSSAAALTGFADHGITTSAGVTRSTIRTSTDRNGWQNNVKLRTLVSKAAVQFKTVLVQSSLDNIKLYHGAAVVNGILVGDPAREWPLISVVYDQTDGVGVSAKVHREYAKYARIIEVGDQVGIGTDDTGWEVTIETEYDPTITDGSGAVVGGHTKLFFSEFEAAALPTISAAGPTAAAVTEIVKLTGTNFNTVTGAAGVKIGGVNATSYEKVGTTVIYAVVPAGSAGSAPIIVTNPAGATAAFAYTRGA